MNRPGQILGTLPSSRTAPPVGVVLLLFRTLGLLLLVLTSCALLEQPEEPPFLITRATLSRIYPEDRHLLALRLRTRTREFRPDRLTLRFRLTTGLDAETSHHTDVEAAASLLSLGERDYELALPFDSPFPFLSKDPLLLTNLTLLTITRNGEPLWEGELAYPYPIDEELPVRGSFQKR